MNNNDTPKWASELSANMRAFMVRAEKRDEQAAEDRAEAARDRKDLIYVIKLTGKVGEKIFSKLIDIADTNHEILLALKGNGRHNNGNGNGRKR